MPATGIAFAALAVVFDGAALVVNSRSVLERPLWTGLWTVLGLWLLAALVVGAPAMGVVAGSARSVSYLVSPVWGARCTTWSSWCSSLCCLRRRCDGMPASWLGGVRPVRRADGGTRQGGCPSA